MHAAECKATLGMSPLRQYLKVSSLVELPLKCEEVDLPEFTVVIAFSLLVVVKLAVVVSLAVVFILVVDGAVIVVGLLLLGLISASYIHNKVV